jgi:hypothetical protein
VERVGSGLANANVLGLHSKALVELPVFCALLKRSLGFLVLDEKHRRSGYSCLGGQGVDSVHDAVDVEGRFRSRTQSLLDVDDEQGVFHGALPIADLGQRHWASRDRLSTSRLSAGNISIPSLFEIASRECESHRIEVHRHDQTSLAHNFPCERRAIARAETDFQKLLSFRQT